MISLADAATKTCESEPFRPCCNVIPRRWQIRIPWVFMPNNLASKPRMPGVLMKMILISYLGVDSMK